VSNHYNDHKVNFTEKRKARKKMRSMFYEVVVVGGGMGGLFTANRLMKAGIKDVAVLESRAYVGGRVSTTFDEDDNPLFNNFAWRVGETNTMMQDLAQELGIKLIKQTTPDQGSKPCKHGPLSSMDCEPQEADPMEIPPNRAPLSDFAAASLTSTTSADLQDRESGYAGRTSQIAWPDESHGNDSWFVDGGMDRLPKELARTLPEGCLLLNHRMKEVEKTKDGYRISVVKRDGNDYTPLELECSQVVLATPPYSLRGLKVAKEMLPALFAVHERRLGHAFAKCKPGLNYPEVPDRSDVPDRVYRKLPESILQQVISGDYGHGVFQAAYACDRFERVWRELQYHGPDVVMNQVKKQLAMISDLKPPPEGWDDAITEVHISTGFVHRWHIEAHVMGKTKEDLSMQAMTPNPARLPGLYLVGEAFSPQQGWTEGALWTADKVANIITKARQSAGKYSFDNSLLGKHSRKMLLKKDEDGKLQGENTPEAIMTYKGMVSAGTYECWGAWVTVPDVIRSVSHYIRHHISHSAFVSSQNTGDGCQ
jgi:monoamine oxidase